MLCIIGLGCHFCCGKDGILRPIDDAEVLESCYNCTNSCYIVIEHCMQFCIVRRWKNISGLCSLIMSSHLDVPNLCCFSVISASHTFNPSCASGSSHLQLFWVFLGCVICVALCSAFNRLHLICCIVGNVRSLTCIWCSNFSPHTVGWLTFSLHVAVVP